MIKIRFYIKIKIRIYIIAQRQSVVGFKNLKINVNESLSVQDIIMQIENYVNRK